jgi:hypothetical protein
MDQSLAIIIASAIAVGGTLGGVYLSNLNNTKSEKRKRDTAIVEEIYQTLIKVDGLCDELVYQGVSLFENWRNWNETNLVCACGQQSKRSRFFTAVSNDLRPGSLIIFCLGLNALMAKRLTPCICYEVLTKS